MIMAYKIDDWKVLSTKADGTQEIEACIWADAVSDIPAYNAVGTGKVLTNGSVAIVPSAGKVKFLVGTAWKEWGEA